MNSPIDNTLRISAEAVSSASPSPSSSTSSLSSTSTSMTTPTINVHLLVLCHGMWGSPAHLMAMKDTMLEHYPTSALAPENEGEEAYELEVLAAESNQEQNTYDGIDWGGERFVKEILEKIESIESFGIRKVTRFSITGYSLGGLLARYVIGALHAQKFFERIEPVNFNTIATPHLGIPRYPNFWSGMFTALGPKLLGRTGLQFYQIDKWNGPDGQPLLEIMSDHDSVFYQALALFPNVTIYANTVNDTTVPYLTAAIETTDPFLLRETNGIEIELDETYNPIIKSYRLPGTPPVHPPPPGKLSKEYWTSFKKPRIFIPPPLRFKFPFNLVVYASLPILFPLFITFAITRLSLDTRASNARTKLLEETDADKVAYIRELFKKLDDGSKKLLENAGAEDVQREVEEVVNELVHVAEEQGITGGTASPVGSHTSGDVLEQSFALATPDSATSPVSSASSTPSSSRPQSPSPNTSSSSSSTTAIPPKKSCRSSRKLKKAQKNLPTLTPIQLKMAASLNALPQLKKQLVYIPGGIGEEAKEGDMHAHAIIVARDLKRFTATHEKGLGVLRHWADQFVL